MLAPLALALILALILGGCSRSAEQIPLAYVACAGNNHVQVIDLSTGETLRKIYAGATPWRLVVSPGRRQLWIQHWYAATTAVVDLEDHEVIATLPLRGPGAFEASGEMFLSFSWPDPSLHRVDAETFEESEPRVTEIREVYDLLPANDGETLYLAQYDPMARGPAPRYGYILAYPYRQAADRAAPLSLHTGASPLALAAPPNQPFVLSADSGTDGLSLLNELHDGRALAACPAPREMAFSPDGSRMAVVCWRGDGWRQSEVVLFHGDFAARPWPALEETARTTLPAGLVAATFSADGSHLWVVDQTGGRLLELDAGSLAQARAIATGDLPMDVVVLPVPPTVRDRLRAGPGRARQRALESLARLAETGGLFTDLSWTETTATGEQIAEGVEQPPARQIRFALRAPDHVRIETEEGGVRIAGGGHSITRDRDGRFWVAPRQELLSTVYALPSLPAEEALRRLAGDVPGSPFLRGGLAMDVSAEVTEQGTRYVLLGAERAGRRVSQLWLDAATARPISLVEQFPSFQGARGAGHGAPPSVEVVETRFEDFVRIEGRFPMPTVLERVLEGGWVQHVRLEGFELDRGLPEQAFSLPGLGAAAPASAVLFGPPPDEAPAAQPGPGQPVPILSAGAESGGIALPGPQIPSTLYNSNPPTSGPYLPFAADWGVHRVPVPLPLQVHSLLDGGVALQYHCPEGCPELVDRLEQVARERDWVLVAPYPLMESRLALTAWGRVELLDGFDAERIDRFLDAWAGRDHHAEVDGAAPALVSGH